MTSYFYLWMGKGILYASIFLPEMSFGRGCKKFICFWLTCLNACNCYGTVCCDPQSMTSYYLGKKCILQWGTNCFHPLPQMSCYRVTWFFKSILPMHWDRKKMQWLTEYKLQFQCCQQELLYGMACNACQKSARMFSNHPF